MQTTVQPTWGLAAHGQPWVPGLILLVLLASAAVIALVYWHESPSASRRTKAFLAGIRTILLGLVLLMLCGWTLQRHVTGRPDLVILIDDSASMGLVDVYDDPLLSAQTRLNLAKALLLENDAALLAQLSERYNVRLYAVGSSARALGEGETGAVGTVDLAGSIRRLTPEQPASRLGNALRDVLEAQRGRPTAAVVILTDGITTEGKSLAESAQYARRRAVPLFLIGLGSHPQAGARPPRDLQLADLVADEAVFAGDVVRFEVKLRAEGYSGQASVRLTQTRSVREEAREQGTEDAGPGTGGRGPGTEDVGQAPGVGEVLDQKQVQIEPGSAPQVVQLAHRTAEPGEFEYVVEVVSLADEANVENNRLSRQVKVQQAAIRVLLVQAQPNYEFRFLKEMLRRELTADSSSGLRTVLQEADPAYVPTDETALSGFPVSRDELFAYDALIFGDVNPALLSPSILQHIYEFVTVRGGGLVVIAGPRYTPLAYRNTPLEPLFPAAPDTVSLPQPDAVITESFRPRLSPLGLASPITQLADVPAENEKLWREQLAPLLWFIRMPKLRPGVRVLAEHPTMRNDAGLPLPIITLQFIGAGKVLFHATDETYRWRFRTGDLYFARYWVQALRYLCRAKLLGADQPVELTMDREEYAGGEPVTLRVRFLDDRLAPQADDGVTVAVQKPGGPRRTIVLRRQAADRGLFEGTAAHLPEGEYRAWIAAPVLQGSLPSRQFRVLAPPGELARTQMDAEGLREAASVSRGKFYTFATADRLLADLPRGRQVRIESLPPQPIWNAPALAALFVLLITTEWILRKRLGLL